MDGLVGEVDTIAEGVWVLINEADLSLSSLVSIINSVQSAVPPSSQPSNIFLRYLPWTATEPSTDWDLNIRLSNLLVQQFTQLSERLTNQITHLTLEIKHASQTYAYLAANFNTTNHLRIANENIVTHSSATLLDKLQPTHFMS
jgi:hypothetical protein